MTGKSKSGSYNNERIFMNMDETDLLLFMFNNYTITINNKKTPKQIHRIKSHL